MNRRHFIFLIFLGLMLTPFTGKLNAQNTQHTQQDFGKNRVQFKNFEWRKNTSPNFEVYHYEYGSKLAIFAIRHAEDEFKRIADLLGYAPYRKTSLFIFNSITDLQQSNIGLYQEDKLIDGQANFIKAKIEIPFSGSLADFKKEISFGIAQIFINEMMYGGSLRQMLQNAALLQLPDWFASGAAAYAAYGWSEEMDNYMRSTVASKKMKKPHRYYAKEAMLIGQSIWNFMIIKYGASNVSNILNLTRITKNEELSISSTLGVPYSKVIQDWRAFYLEMAQDAENDYNEAPYQFKLRKTNRDKRIFHQVKISPDGKYVAYSENKRGRYKVIVKDIERNKKKAVLLRHGYLMNTQRIDPWVPLLAWSGENLAITYKKKGLVKTEIYSLKKKKIWDKTWEFFNQVRGFDITADGNYIALSADRQGVSNIKSGQNDLFYYDVEEKILKKITDDYYDEFDPVFLGNSPDVIVFSSNRTNDTIQADQGNVKSIGKSYNLFLYNPRYSEKVFEQLTDHQSNHIKPVSTNDSTLFFLNDKNGIYNVNRLDLVDKKQTLISNYRQSIQNYDIHEANQDMAFRIHEKGKQYMVYNTDFSTQTSVKERKKTPRVQFLEQGGVLEKSIEDKQFKIDPYYLDSAYIRSYQADPINTDHYQLDPEAIREYVQEKDKQIESNERIEQEQKIQIKGAYPYEPRFSTEALSFSPTIDPLRGFGLSMHVDLTDILENHRMSAGFLNNISLKNGNYFIDYTYLGKRIDYILRYDRSTVSRVYDEFFSHQYASNYVHVQLAYPFTNSNRISLIGGYRDTKFTDLSLQNLARPDVYRSYAVGGIEWVYDNTVIKGLNVMTGVRAKAVLENNWSLEESNKSFYKLYFDFRYYKPVDREIVWASRLAIGHFGGSAPKTFALGGMDNWIGAQNNGGTSENNPLTAGPAQDNSDILFLEYATNLRGFNYNTQSGSSYFVFNTELRLPIVKYLFKGAITNSFLQNLQFIAFGDIGSAWTDISPFNKKNNLNTSIIGGAPSPFTIEVNNYKNPFLMSYGAGVRSLIFGYYIKLDAAWPVEDLQPASSPNFYLTIGYDF